MNTCKEITQSIYKKIAAGTAALSSLEASTPYLWTRVKLDKYRDILDLFEIPADISSIIKKITTRPGTIKKAISKIDHETRALEKSLEDNGITPAQATAAAESLDTQADDVTAAVNRLRQDLDGLDRLEQRIKADLNLNTLMTLAGSRLVGSHRETFAIGNEIFRTITEVASEQDDTANLSRLYDRISAIIDHISSRSAPQLPGLAARVFDHLINRVVNAARDLQENIRAILATAKEDMENIRAIRNEIDRREERNIQEHLDFADHSAGTLEKTMSALADRDEIAELVPAVIMSATQLKFFDDCLSQDFMKQLSARVRDPARFAAMKTENFFKGIGGLWRLLRLALIRISGADRVITPAEISTILEKLIRDCPAFHGRRPEDVDGIRRLIESVIDNCQRPFPHDDLMRLGKSTILEYGDYCEAAFASLPLPEEIPVPVGVKKPRAELGAMVTSFEKGVMTLGENLR